MAARRSEARSRVALVHDQLLVNAGAESVFRDITAIVDGDVLCSVLNPDKIDWLTDHHVRQTILARMPKARAKHTIYSPVMLDVWRKVDLSPYDVVLCDSHSFCHAVLGRADAFRSVYYYTPARALWTPEIDGRASSGRLAPVKKLLARRMKPIDFRAAQHWDHRMAISRTSADRVERFYRQPCPKVIYPGVDVDKFADVRRTGDDAGLVLWSRLIPYKRFDLVIDAARRLGIPAQIVGEGPHRAALEARAEGDPNIHFHGRLPDAELKKILARARAVVFPAYEDFGIVPVEAMSAGVPVVVLDRGGAAETVRPQDGALFSDSTPEAIADAVRALDDLPFDPEATRAHAHFFSNERFRREYREEIESAAERHLGRRVEIFHSVEPRPSVTRA